MSRNLYEKMFGQSFTDKYFVEDIGDISKAKVICVLESPHTDEVLLKIPACGPSGKVITKHFIDKNNETSIGRLLDDSDPIAQNIYIINSLLVPMQRTPYKSNNYNYRFSNLLRDIFRFKRIYTNIEDHVDDIFDVISNNKDLVALVNDFKLRIENAVRSAQYKCCILLCGVEAKAIFDYAFSAGFTYERGELIKKQIEFSYKNIEVACIPHPSPNDDGKSRWDYNENRNYIKLLKKQHKF